jgi:hypothetical protein
MFEQNVDHQPCRHPRPSFKEQVGSLNDLCCLYYYPYIVMDIEFIGGLTVNISGLTGIPYKHFCNYEEKNASCLRKGWICQSNHSKSWRICPQTTVTRIPCHQRHIAVSFGESPKLVELDGLTRLSMTSDC